MVEPLTRNTTAEALSRPMLPADDLMAGVVDELERHGVLATTSILFDSDIPALARSIRNHGPPG